MIVVAVIGILMAVAIPKYGEVLEKANLGATLGNIAALRSVITIYYSDNAIFPTTIDINDPKMAPLLGVSIPPVQCRYPSSNPPEGNSMTYGIDVPTGMDSGWYYNNQHGYIYINSTALDIKGYPYTMY